MIYIFFICPWKQTKPLPHHFWVHKKTPFETWILVQSFRISQNIINWKVSNMAIEIFSLSLTFSFLHAKTIENYQAKISITQPWLHIHLKMAYCNTFKWTHWLFKKLINKSKNITSKFAHVQIETFQHCEWWLKVVTKW